MKRILSILVLLLCFLQANAVLKEKDLSQTLGVLRMELETDFYKQKQNMQRMKMLNEEQHAKLINYMKRSEQIGLILYSQKSDFTFDMAYACQEATLLYRQLTLNTIPYDRIRKRVQQEIERYKEMIALLKQMPPAVAEARDSVLEVDSLLLEVDSASANQHHHINDGHDHEDEVLGPFLLEGEDLKHRDMCLQYAQALLGNLEKFLDVVSQEKSYYEQVSDRVEKLNSFAQSRYEILQQSIFKDGGSNYFKILMSLPMQLMLVKNDFINKYHPLAESGAGVSEWRGAYVMFISFFMVIYIILSTALSNIILRWLVPKRFRTKTFMQKRKMMIYVLGVALFAVFVIIARQFTDRNFILMGTGLMSTFAWLMEVIFLSMLIRLNPSQMKNGAKVYIPFIAMAFVVIVFRIMLIPNSLVNLIYPPILLFFTIWQTRTLKKHRDDLPPTDKFYSTISLVAMIVATIASWVGYTLLAVEIMMWWMFQLTAIQTITCFFDLVKMYERRHLLYKLMPQLKVKEKNGEDVTEDKEALILQIKGGKFITQTWVYDFIHKSAIPILAVLSVLFSIFLAADIFEMRSVCVKIFMTNFIEQEGIISLSLFKICMVAGSWYLFRYLNYVTKALYHHIRRRTLGDSKEDYNGTLANNIISILVWGGYCIFILLMLKVPSTGISIVTGGLATGMGFAMKDLLENFFYGISLMSGRVRVGDYVECDGIRGRVEKITYQSTMLLTMDGCVIAFLNSSLFSKNFKNLTRNHQYELIKIPVGVAYGCNVREVRKMLEDALQPLKEEENMAGKLLIDENSSITVAFSNFGDNSVDLLVCIWMLVEESVPLTSRVKEVIYDTLNANNINIPFPQRDIYIHEFPGAK